MALWIGVWVCLGVFAVKYRRTRRERNEDAWKKWNREK